MNTDRRSLYNTLIGYQALLLLFILAFFCPSVSAAVFTDDDGTPIKFDKPYNRIISLYPAHTENLIYLGVKEKLVGISTSDSNQDETAGIKRFSYRDDPEKFIAQQPDLVLIRPMISRAYPGLITHLKQTGITVCSLQPRSIEAMFTYWLTLGKLSESEEQAQDLIKQFKNRLVKLEEKVELIPFERRPKVYFEAIHSRMKTFSPASMAIFCLEKAGGVNIAPEATPRNNTNIASYGKERILGHADQIDIFLAQKGRMNPVTLDIITNESGFKAIKAIRNNQVYLIDEHLVSRPTPRLLSGVEEIQNILYPETVQ